MPKVTKETTKSAKGKVGKAKATKEKKGAKKEKDPNAPKRPTTAYFFFLNDKRAQIKEENPGVKVTEVTKIASEMWKNVSAAEKKKYEDLNAKDKQRYEKEMAAYNAE